MVVLAISFAFVVVAAEIVGASVWPHCLQYFFYSSDFWQLIAQEKALVAVAVVERCLLVAGSTKKSFVGLCFVWIALVAVSVEPFVVYSVELIVGNPVRSNYFVALLTDCRSW